LTEAPRSNRPFVERYGIGGFRISGKQWRGSVLILTNRVTPWSSAIHLATPQPLIDVLAADGVEMLIVGFGDSNRLIPAFVRNSFKEAGLMLEGMDTGAACRTYNLLAGERSAVGALLAALPERQKETSPGTCRGSFLKFM